MTRTRNFESVDSAGKLMALGFTRSRHFPGFEMEIDRIRVTATVGSDYVFIRGIFYTARQLGEMHMRIPAHASLGAYTDALINIVSSFRPEYINRDAEFAKRHLRILKLSRPNLQVSRTLLRRSLNDLMAQIKDIPVPDVNLDYRDNIRTGEECVLSVAIGNQQVKIPATGLWVGRIWVKPRDLFKALDQRFQTDPVGIRLYDNQHTPGKWLCIGNRSMRAGWEPSPGANATEPCT